MEKENGASLALGFQALLLPENAESMEDLIKIAKTIGKGLCGYKPYSQHKFFRNT